MKTRYRVEFLYDVPDASGMTQFEIVGRLQRVIRDELLLWPDYAYRDLTITRQGRIRGKRAPRVAPKKRKAAK